VSSSKPIASEVFHQNSLPACDRLDVIDAASTLEDIALPHFGLHELKGDRAGTWAVKVNKNWRLTFRFADGDASEVNFEDYH
jgi:toxin HigB-1